MDTYQAVYDAVRLEIGSASFVIDALRQEALIALAEHQRPSVLYRPQLMADGTAWCALYGEDLQVGVAGFGDTPDAAMQAFDRAWLNERTPTAIRLQADAAPLPPAAGGHVEGDNPLPWQPPPKPAGEGGRGDEEVQPYPKDGEPFYVHTREVWRWIPYKTDGARQMKAAGRWQHFKEYGFENAELAEGLLWSITHAPAAARTQDGGEDARA